jgi:hypothetical protein
MTARMHEDAIAGAERAENWLLLDRFIGTEDTQSCCAPANGVSAVEGVLHETNTATATNLAFFTFSIEHFVSYPDITTLIR